MAANVLTQRNAPDRQGINREETILNPGNVDFSTFGRIGSYPVVGTVYAQPLFVSGVSIGGRERNVVVVVTMENMVYAFDAAQTGAAAQIWPAGRSPNGLKLGEPVPSRQFEKTSQNLNDPGGYNDFYQKPIGLLSTPVVDPAAGAPTIYLVSAQFDQARFQANGSVATADMFQHILYAIDLRTGNILRQQAITGQYPGSGYRNTPNPGTLPPQRPLHVDNATHTSSMIINFAGHAVTMTDATGWTGRSPWCISIRPCNCSGRGCCCKAGPSPSPSAHAATKIRITAGSFPTMPTRSAKAACSAPPPTASVVVSGRPARGWSRIRRATSMPAPAMATMTSRVPDRFCSAGIWPRVSWGSVAMRRDFA